MSAKIAAGRLVWHELSVKNVEEAKGFYGELFGWKTRSMDMGPMGSYHVAIAGEKEVAGFGTLQGSGPASWLAYTTTTDVEAAVERAKKHGAKVEVPPTDIPNVGRFAILRDAQGARFAPFLPARADEPEPAGPPAVGSFCWTEVVTQDPEAARTLYTDTFGWSAESKDMGPMGNYIVLKRGDAMAAGIMKKLDPNAPSMWLSYVAVDDVDASLAKAKRLGGSELLGAREIPNVGRFAVVADKAGAAIALFKG